MTALKKGVVYSKRFVELNDSECFTIRHMLDLQIQSMTYHLENCIDDDKTRTALARLHRIREKFA